MFWRTGENREENELMIVKEQDLEIESKEEVWSVRNREYSYR
jgi:hypothetical protein